MVLLHQVLEVLVEQIQIGPPRLARFRANDRWVARVPPQVPIAAQRLVKYLSVLLLLQRGLRIAITDRTAAPGLWPRQVVMAVAAGVPFMPWLLPVNGGLSHDPGRAARPRRQIHLSSILCTDVRMRRVH